MTYRLTNVPDDVIFSEIYNRLQTIISDYKNHENRPGLFLSETAAGYFKGFIDLYNDCKNNSIPPQTVVTVQASSPATTTTVPEMDPIELHKFLQEEEEEEEDGDEEEDAGPSDLAVWRHYGEDY